MKKLVIILLLVLAPCLVGAEIGGGGIQGVPQNLSLTSMTTKGTTGGLTIKKAEATATMSGGTTVIAVNTPVLAAILGTQLRVDTAITSDNATKTWAAAYTANPTQAICTGQAFTKNTKVSTMYDIKTTTNIVSSGVNTITITAAAGSFTGGVVRAIVYYLDFETMIDN